MEDDISHNALCRKPVMHIEVGDVTQHGIVLLEKQSVSFLVAASQSALNRLLFPFFFLIVVSG